MVFLLLLRCILLIINLARSNRGLKNLCFFGRGKQSSVLISVKYAKFARESPPLQLALCAWCKCLDAPSQLVIPKMIQILKQNLYLNFLTFASLTSMISKLYEI